MAEEELKDQDPPRGLCPECQAGLLHIRYITYFTWLNEELITVPNFPALICDVCGKREYDPRAIKWLNALLKPETGHRLPKSNNYPPKSDHLQP